MLSAVFAAVFPVHRVRWAGQHARGGVLRCMMMRERHRQRCCRLYNQRAVVFGSAAMETSGKQM